MKMLDVNLRSNIMRKIEMKSKEEIEKIINLGKKGKAMVEQENIEFYEF